MLKIKVDKLTFSAFESLVQIIENVPVAERIPSSILEENLVVQHYPFVAFGTRQQQEIVPMGSCLEHHRQPWSSEIEDEGLELDSDILDKMVEHRDELVN